MYELVPISFTFESLIKSLLIITINMFLGYFWYSSYGFQKQWRQIKPLNELNRCTTKAIVISNIATIFNAFLIHILLIAFDIRKQQWLSAVLTSMILSGFSAFNGLNDLFFSTKSEYQSQRLLYFIDFGFTFVLYSFVSLILVSY